MASEKNTDIFSKVNAAIKRTKEKKNTYVISFRGVRIITIASGMFITILSGWQGVKKVECVKNIVLMISALITALAAAEGLFDLKNKALRYDLLLFDLRKLRDEIEFDIARNPNALEEKKEEYQKRYREILESKKDIIEDSYSEENGAGNS